jgi:hypothetical protein
MGKKAAEEEFERFANSVWAEFLNNATAKEIHQSVIDSNWDGNKFLLNWIKDNPNVDKAAVLIAYWMSGLRWNKQYKDREDASLANRRLETFEFDFTEEIERKYQAGFWKNGNIELNPKCDCDGYDWTSDYLDKTTVRDIPAVMFEKLEGEKVDRPDDGWAEGLPMAYYMKIEDFLDEYEIE